MELEIIKLLTGTGADTVTIIIGWVLIKHELRIQKLEGGKEKAAQ